MTKHYPLSLSSLCARIDARGETGASGLPLESAQQKNLGFPNKPDGYLRESTLFSLARRIGDNIPSNDLIEAGLFYDT